MAKKKEDKKLTKPANPPYPSWTWNETEWQYLPPVNVAANLLNALSNRPDAV